MDEIALIVSFITAYVTSTCVCYCIPVLRLLICYLRYLAFVKYFMELQAAAQSATAAAAATSECNIWILKPVGLSRGRGISLIQDMSQVAYSQTSVIQVWLTLFSY